jgi:hypothetical protein
MTSISAERTLGHSPKVIWPGLATAALGSMLMLLGSLFDDMRLRAIGLGALGSSWLITAIGYVAPPGAVVPPDHDVTDIHEHDDTARRFAPSVAQPPGEQTPAARTGEDQPPAA